MQGKLSQKTPKPKDTEGISPRKNVRHGSVKYAVRGSQIVFQNTETEFPYEQRINYVVDTEKFYKRGRGYRRSKSANIKVKNSSTTNHKEYFEKDFDAEFNILNDVIIEIDREIPEEKKENPALRSPSKRSRWTVLRSVIRAVCLFRRNEAEIINNEEELDRALEEYASRSRACSVYQPRQNFFDEHYREERLYELIAKGSPADMIELDDMIKKDCRTYLHSPSEPTSLLNAPNRAGRTPLYIATQNGNLGMVKFLISREANPLIKSKVSPTEEESCLAVAARWKHAKIVELYLEYYEWPYDELKIAKKVAGNTNIRALIQQKIDEIKPKKCCLCCMPAKKIKKKKI